jgi:hypothetical protein
VANPGHVVPAVLGCTLLALLPSCLVLWQGHSFSYLGIAGHGQVPPARLMKLAQAAAGHGSLLTVIPAEAACDQDE